MDIKKALFTLAGIGCMWVAQAQKFGEHPVLNDPFHDKTCETYTASIQLPAEGTIDEVVKNYLNDQFPAFESSLSEPVLQYYKSSPGGEHLSYLQFFAGIEVFNSEVKVNLTKQRRTQLIFDNSFETTDWDAQSIESTANSLGQVSLGASFVKALNLENVELTETITIAVIDDKTLVLKKLEVLDIDQGYHRLFLIDKDLQVFVERDLVAYGGTPTPAQLTVFNPDPLTSAETGYLAPYVDSSDSDVFVINAERKTVTIDVDLDGGVYSLQNDYIRLEDYSQPTDVPVTSTTPFFNYTRSEDGFEHSNVYYHLTTFNDYVRSLGYNALSDNLVRADAHALNGSDNSQFIGSSVLPSLYFGTGGVDDAEDADVIVHEYGHGLSYFASPNSNSGSERTAIDEGVGDYFAATYSKSISNFEWSNIFNWDGHNEYWNGRSAAVTTKYPDDLGFSIHANGQMWSTALMEIHAIIGPVQADKLALETMFYFSNNMTFTDAALAYLAADSVLFGGANYNVAFPIFVNRGFLDATDIAEIDLATDNVNLANSEGFSFYDQPVLITSVQPVVSVELYNINGQLIDESGDLNSYTYSYQPETSLSNGIYILKVVTDKGRTATFNLLKSRQ